MVDIDTFRKMALSFPEVVEMPHFEKTSFRIRGKIFVTHEMKTHRIVLKLSEMDQHSFVKNYPTCSVPVSGSWGKHGWTTIDLNLTTTDILKGALIAAYCEVAPKKLSSIVLNKELNSEE